MSDKRVVVAGSRAELADLVADKFVVRVRKLVRRQGHASILLTGGTIAQEVYRAIASHPARDTVDWSTVDFWWGDERFVPAGDPERNDHQAEQALLQVLSVPADRIHRMPSASDGVSVEEGAKSYADLLRARAGDGEEWPACDLAFVGMGADAHVLSVFPGSAEAQLITPGVVAVTDSPKPPPQRITLTIPLLNRSKRVWMVVAGADKAAALGLALANAQPAEVPASAVSGTQSTKVFIDAELAEALPAEFVTKQKFWSADDERADYVPNALR
jgi:6-phosphogluconolactonase